MAVVVAMAGMMRPAISLACEERMMKYIQFVSTQNGGQQACKCSSNRFKTTSQKHQNSTSRARPKTGRKPKNKKPKN
jgi:hypothetical protein